MRIYHPQHGILFTTDQAEIDRLISTGGAEFDVNEKPWKKKEPIAESIEEVKIKVIEEKEEIKPELTIHVPKRGRPAKHGNY
jgi:hypothetical protein